MSSLRLKSQGILPLSDSDDLETLPSPKMKPSEAKAIFAWSHAYAGFSPSFAEAALNFLNVGANHKIIDPFTGSGTSAIAAAKLGCNFAGSDLDPFSALLTKAKTANQADQKVVDFLLSNDCDAQECEANFSEEAIETFSPDDLSYASNVFAKIKSRIALDGQDLYNALLTNKKGELSSELVTLVSLLICAKKRSSATRGSNPVWFKRDVATFDKAQVSLYDCANEIASTMIGDLDTFKKKPLARKIKISSGDFESMKLRNHSGDFLLTSPPYLNRLDYIVSHLPELTLLSGLFSVDLEALRKKMMGTTKMVSSPIVLPTWGDNCRNILDRIRDHKSVASSTYYHRFHAQYFSELFRFLRWSKKVMKVGGKGLLVIQDSYYKDIRIPIAEIIEEMGLSLGIEVGVVRTDKRLNHIGSMDPKQRAYVKSKELHEKTLFLAY